MSRVLQPKSKDLVNLEVVDSKKVWVKNNKGNFELSSDFEYYGKVEKGLSSFITVTNKKGVNSHFVEDTCCLPKKTKKEIVNHLVDKNLKVVYLVKKKK